jgi:isopentenyl-diphosphate delta-isomerase
VAVRAEERELIVLVDETGRAIGTAEKGSAHHADTPLHLGFSCYVFDEEGRFLATRRASTKQVWPGVWSNTVCGHPAPGETLAAAVERRLEYELGMTASDVMAVLPRHIYRAPAFQGIVEHEFCPVFVARAAGVPRLNPGEVGAFEWVRWDDFVRAADADVADAYSWWCKNQLRELRAQPALGGLAGWCGGGGVDGPAGIGGHA